MKRTWMIAILAGGILGLLGAGSASADSPYKKYQENMKKYREHMAEAHEEAEDHDWDDYREELQKAQQYYWRAQQYAPAFPDRHGYWGAPRDTWGRPSHHPNPGFHGGGYYYAPPPFRGGDCRRDGGFFGFGR